jgi:hypothetical protein
MLEKLCGMKNGTDSRPCTPCNKPTEEGGKLGPLVWLTLPKRRALSEQHGVTTHKAVLLIVTDVSTSGSPTILSLASKAVCVHFAHFVLRAHKTSRLLFSHYLIIRKQEVLARTNRLLPFDTTRTAQKITRPTILIFLRVYSLPR